MNKQSDKKPKDKKKRARRSKTVNVSSFFIGLISYVLSLLSSPFAYIYKLVIPDKKNVNILMVGLPESGKTQIINWLKKRPFIEDYTPGFGYVTSDIEYNNLAFKIYELAGQTINLWPDRCRDKQCIIFVVDSSAPNTIGNVRTEIQQMMDNDDLRDAMLLVFANKKDLPDSMNAEYIADKLGLTSFRGRTYKVIETSAKRGVGFAEGLEWLEEQFSNA